MGYLKLAVGIALVLAVFIYLTRPAEPKDGVNVIAYDGENYTLNGRGIKDAALRQIDFPKDARILVSIDNIDKADFGAGVGLIEHWSNQGYDYYYQLENGASPVVHTMTWRKATPTEIVEEIEAKRPKRVVDQMPAQDEVYAVPPRNPGVPDLTGKFDRPRADQEDDIEDYRPTDKHRYIFNNQEIGNEETARRYLKRLKLVRPSAVQVLAPEFNAPPPEAQSLPDLGFPPAVTEFMTRAARNGVIVKVHKGPGFKPPKPQASQFRLFGGAFFAYMAPIILMLAGVFVAMYILEGTSANREGGS